MKAKTWGKIFFPFLYSFLSLFLFLEGTIPKHPLYNEVWGPSLALLALLSLDPSLTTLAVARGISGAFDYSSAQMP